MRVLLVALFFIAGRTRGSPAGPSSEEIFASLTKSAPAEMKSFLDAFRKDILAPTATEMVANAALVGLSAAVSTEDVWCGVPAASGDMNPVCYQFPNETYADLVMAKDPLIKNHEKVHDSCPNQGFSIYLTNDPVFTDTEFYRSDRAEDTLTNYKIVEEEPPQTTSSCLPIVQMHGMGDFAKNPAYKRLGEAVSATLSGSKDGCPLVTPQLGAGVVEDIVGGFLRPLEPSVDYFAEVLKNDSSIAAAGGVFNAIGYSQGNVIIRGYAELYAGKEGYPKLNHHLSMFGMHMGVAGFPGCNMTAHAVCRSLAELLGELAYIPAIQAHLMQANYFVSAACHPRIVRLSRALPLLSSPTSSPHSPRRTPLSSSRTDDCSDLITLPLLLSLSFLLAFLFLFSIISSSLLLLFPFPCTARTDEPRRVPRRGPWAGAAE